MSYGLRYYNTIQDEYSNTYDIEIYQSGFTGSSSKKKIGATINFPDVDRYAPIFSSGVELQLVNTFEDGFLKYADMGVSVERDHLVRISNGSTTYFEGFIVPELYEDSYNCLPYVVSFAANDGLSDLERFNPVLSTYQSLIKTIAQILQLTGHNYEIMVCSSLFELEHTKTSTYTLFEQTYLDSLAFLKSDSDYMNGKDILKEILSSFRTTIFFKKGKWYIIRYDDLYKTGSRTFVRYDYQGNKITGTVNETVSIISLNNSGTKWRDASQSLTIKRGVKTIEVEQDLSKYSSIINFNNIFSAQSVTNGVALNPDRHEWEYHQSLVLNLNEGSTYFTINPDGNYQAYYGLATKTEFTKGSVNSVLSFKYEIEPDYYSVQQQLANYGNCDFWAAIMLKVITDSESFYVTYDLENDIYDTSPTEAVIIKECNYSDWEANAIFDYGLKKISFDIKMVFLQSSLSENNIVLLKILPIAAKGNNTTTWQAANITNWTAIKNMEMSMELEDEQDNVIEGTINTGYIERETIKLKYSDVSNNMYKNGYRLSNYGLTKGWSTVAENDYIPLTNRYILDGFQTYNQPRFTLTGDLISNTIIYPDTIIQDSNIPDRYFNVTGLKWDINNSTFRIKLDEYVNNDNVTLG